jgi:hypothetical protein
MSQNNNIPPNNRPPNPDSGFVNFQNDATVPTYPNPLSPNTQSTSHIPIPETTLTTIQEQVQEDTSITSTTETSDTNQESIEETSTQSETTSSFLETDNMLQHIFNEERWTKAYPKSSDSGNEDDDTFENENYYPIVTTNNDTTIQIIEDIHEQYVNRNEEARLQQIYNNPKFQQSWWGLLARATQIHHTSTQNELYANIQDSEKEGIEFKSIKEFPDISDKHPSGIKLREQFTAVEAIISAQTQTKGISHVNLLHSGFSVDLMRPGMNKVNAILRYIANTKFELGKQLGMIYYLHSDVLIRKYILEHLYSSITNSSLEGFRKYNTFLKALNILDYDTLLWSIVNLLYPEGYTFSVVCSNPECAHVEHVPLDLANLKLIIYSKIREINISLSKSKSLNDVQNYQNNLFKETIATAEHPEWMFEMRAPSCYDFFESGERFVASTLKEFHTPKPEDMNDIIMGSYYRILAPWVKSFIQKLPNGDHRVIYNDISSTDDTSTTSDTNIERLMPAFQTDNNSLHWKIQDYIRKQQIVYYGVYYNECPVCHTTNTASKNGFIPVDVQNTFFFLAGVRFAQNVRNLNPKKDTTKPTEN